MKFVIFDVIIKKYRKLAVLAIILITSITHVVLTGCSSTSATDSDSANEAGVTEGNTDAGTRKIIATIFPEYDWVRELIKGTEESWELSLLLDNGVDMHSFQPSAKDIMEMSSCDLLIYVGGESDNWVRDVIPETSGEKEESSGDSLAVDSEDSEKNTTQTQSPPAMEAMSLMDILGDKARAEELKEGMAGDTDGENDEHVWLSLRNAKIFCQAIAEELSMLDPENAEIYNKNLNAYLEKLEELDGEYEKAVSEAPVKVLMFGDRFPFRYLVDDYGLDYYAAFAGCSAETEASFETVAFLSGKAKELGLDVILIIDGSDGKLAETICENTGNEDMKILTLDSIQSVTASDIEEGNSYLSIMESDLSVLKQALGL